MQRMSSVGIGCCSLGNRLGKVTAAYGARYWGPWCLHCSESGVIWDVVPGCTAKSFVLQSPPNNSVSLLTFLNNFFPLKLVRVRFCCLQWNKGVRESEEEIPGGGESEGEKPELLRERMWQIRLARWTGTTEAGHWGHEKDSLLYSKSNEKSVKF